MYLNNAIDEVESIFFTQSPEKLIGNFEKSKKCFVDKGGGRSGCEILKVKSCKNCVFYKSVEKAEKDRLKALKRINNLETGTRIYITKRYFKEAK